MGNLLAKFISVNSVPPFLSTAINISDFNAIFSFLLNVVEQYYDLEYNKSSEDFVFTLEIKYRHTDYDSSMPSIIMKGYIHYNINKNRLEGDFEY